MRLQGLGRIALCLPETQGSALDAWSMGQHLADEGHFFPFPVFQIDHLLTPDTLKPAVTLVTIFRSSSAKDHLSLRLSLAMGASPFD